MKMDGRISFIVVEAIKSLDNIYEARLLSWCLAKSQAVLKNYHRNLEEISLQRCAGLQRVTIPARLLLPPGDHDTRHIIESFTLAKKVIPCQRDGQVLHLNIISNPMLYREANRSYVTFYIHEQLWLAMLDLARGWRIADLSTMQILSSKYALIIYLHIANQKKPITIRTETLLELTGTRGKAYKRSFNVKARILEQARKELDEKAPTTFTYEAVTVGRKIEGWKLTPKVNTAHREENSEREEMLRKQSIAMDERVREYLTFSWHLPLKEIEKLEKLIQRIEGSWDDQIAELARIKENADRARPKNPTAYLVRSLHNRLTAG